eukprot:TRINITY_DN45808_c0_g1_i1.p1 TRINITY_DN45808_c0_g1~~TRINITY_DN45808_c0_g1_i1.p1  ORF type:complete len:277 (-),score=74.57 TRINITY_DN45808_c0_g1_i1:76-906(-)
MPCKVYGHVDVGGRPPLCVPFDVQRPEEEKFGALKQALLARLALLHPEAEPLDYGDCCFWNQDSCPIPDRSPVAVFAWEHNDFFLRPLPEGDGAAGALAASREKRGELSYYYAHDRRQQSLVSRPAAAAVAPAPAAVQQREPLRVSPSDAGAGKFNAKQSPFGTDISQYETITSYTWEDHDGDTVKVLVPLDGVGKLPPGKVRASFGLRQFELLVEDYNGKNLRFACNKTHGEMKPEECKHVVRANRVNLVLRKAKEKDIWFDLFKKRAIGDDDDP